MPVSFCAVAKGGFHVARVHHAGKLYVHGPFQGTIHFAGNIVPMQRLAGVFQFLHQLGFGLGRHLVDVVASQRDAELLSPDQLAQA